MQANNNMTLSDSFAALKALMDIIRPWFIAACLLITAILLLPTISQLAESYQILLRYLPYGLAALVILLGHQFVQGRISFAAINLLIGYGLIQTQLQAPLEQNAIRASFTLLSIYWPLNFFIIYWFPERKVTSIAGLVLIVILAIEILSGYLIISFLPDYPQLLNQYLPLLPFGQNSEHIMVQWILPLATSILLLLTSLILFIHTFIKRDRSHSVLLACMITSALICGWFDQSGSPAFFVA